LDIQTAMRLCHLVREYKRSLSHTQSLLRRILRLLASAPAENAGLCESTLDWLETALASNTDLMLEHLTAAREGAGDNNDMHHDTDKDLL
jgi:hypothetical protein